MLERDLKNAAIDNVIKICQVLDISVDELASAGMPENVHYLQRGEVLIPLIGRISCGEPITATENIERYIAEPGARLPSGTLFYLQAKGDSMAPTIGDGSLVLIREQEQVEDGEIAAVLLEGDSEATLKRVKREKGMILLIPDNRMYAPITLTEDSPGRIIGKAVRVTVEL
jgi:repressor LexA